MLFSHKIRLSHQAHHKSARSFPEKIGAAREPISERAPPAPFSVAPRYTLREKTRRCPFAGLYQIREQENFKCPRVDTINRTLPPLASENHQRLAQDGSG